MSEKPSWGPFWTWDQSAGLMLDPTGKRLAGGYSGKRSGLNNPAKQHETAYGPIPQGLWSIGALRRSAKTGPNIMDLTPLPGTQTFGRTAFQIHGDNGKGNRSASSGCIILPPQARTIIGRSAVKTLRVIA
jgi:Protein of unknown function (DUF2778)